MVLFLQVFLLADAVHPVYPQAEVWRQYAEPTHISSRTFRYSSAQSGADLESR